MGKTNTIIGIALLLCGGCQWTAPTVPRFEVDDPFRIVHAPNVSALPVQDFFPETNANEHNAVPASVAVPFTAEDAEDTQRTQSDSLVQSEPPEEESINESEENPPMSLDEQEELLSQGQWSKNIARINMLDTGRKPHFAGMSPEERQRWEQISQLNMSDKEREKRQNQKFDYVDGTTSDWRWMHRGVDKLYAMPPEQRVKSDVFLQTEYKNQKLLQANAAILLGRDGNPDANVRKFLLSLAKDEKTNTFTRCAAVEVLGRMEAITANDLLPLLDNVKDKEVETTDRKTGVKRMQRQPGNLDVWEELLVAIAEKINPWEHDCFIEPFHSPVYDIRLAVAKIWRRESLQKQSKGALPEKFLEIAKRENAPAVRVEIIKTLGAWQVPNLFSLLENDLKHRMTMEIRNAAILTLADAGCQEAIPMIKEQLKETNETSRAAAVSALRKLGAFDDVFKHADDQFVLVRVEVAKALSERCSRQTANIAENYVADRSTKVQLATIEAVDGWSIEESGRLLLMAAKSFHPDVRCRAVELLVGHGVDYPGFDPEDRPENQTVRYQELVEIFCEETGVNPRLDSTGKDRPAVNKSPIQQVSATVPDATLSEVRQCLDDWSNVGQRPLIQRRLIAQGSRLMPSIDNLMTVEKRTIPESLDSIFAEVEPMFREIEKLRSSDLATKQKAARELAQLGTVDSPSKLAAKRMIDLMARQTDPTILTSLLAALQNADAEFVGSLARPLAQSESAHVRRMSCEMLAQFGNSKDVPLLHNMLRDPNRVVVKGALSAMDVLLEEESADSPVFGTLKTMLLKPGEPDLQTAVAAILHRHGHREGTDTFRRLAVSSDYQTRKAVAMTVSELGDPVFVPLLIHFLDDGNGTVKNEALKGLPKLAGQDIGGNVPTQQQVDRWKAWGKERDTLQRL